GGRKARREKQKEPTPLSRHHGIRFRSRKNWPDGPLEGSRQSHTAVSAPCSTLRGASLPPMSVLTQPGLIEFTRMPVPATSAASVHVKALSADFDTRYAGLPPAICCSWPSPLETLTIRP